MNLTVPFRMNTKTRLLLLSKNAEIVYVYGQMSNPSYSVEYTLFEKYNIYLLLTESSAWLNLAMSFVEAQLIGSVIFLKDKLT